MKTFIGRNLMNPIYCLFFLLCFFYASEAMESNNDEYENAAYSTHVRINTKSLTPEDIKRFKIFLRKKFKANVENQQVLERIEKKEKENDVLKTEFEEKKSNIDENRLCDLFDSCKTPHKISYKEDHTEELEHFKKYVQEKLEGYVKNQQVLELIEQKKEENDALNSEFKNNEIYSKTQQNDDVEKTENEVNDSAKQKHVWKYVLKLQGLLNNKKKLKENLTCARNTDEHLEMTCGPGEICTSAGLCVKEENLYKFRGECGRWQEKYDKTKFKYVPQVYDLKNKKWVPQLYGEKKKKVGGKRMEIQNTCAWNEYCSDNGFCKEVSYGDQLKDIRKSDWLEKTSSTWPTVYYYGYLHQPHKEETKSFFKELNTYTHKVIFTHYFIVVSAPPLKDLNSFRAGIPLELIKPEDLKFVKPFVEN